MRLRTVVACFKSLFTPPPPPPKRGATRAERDAALREKAAAEGRGPIDTNSVVDVFKLFDLDPSLEGRAEVRRELGLTGEYSGTAEQNDALMAKIHEHLDEIWNAKEV